MQEVQSANYEARIDRLSRELEQARNVAAVDNMTTETLTNALTEPMAGLLRAVRSLRRDERERKGIAAGTVQAAAGTLAGRFDAVLGTDFLELVEAAAPGPWRRFHLATVLDEIVLEAGEVANNEPSRISVFVHPSLPKWLYGDETNCRAATHQMIEYARLVSEKRTLVLTAMQEVSGGNRIQVRYELQIPPPALGTDNVNVLRECINDSEAEIELTHEADETTTMRCSFSFEVVEEFEVDRGWVRGLRTLVVQESSTNDIGIRQALSAFGIIGYVVTNQTDLVDALDTAEAQANPYRLILVDADI